MESHDRRLCAPLWQRWSLLDYGNARPARARPIGGVGEWPARNRVRTRHIATPVPARMLARCYCRQSWPPVRKTVLTAVSALAGFIAGCEVMFRIAVASRHSPEKIGFHSPGLTGTYGAAVAAGRVYGLTAEQMTNAIGIAGSLSSGLLAFSKSAQGGMVKRLHLGRAAESGILAARLASAGYTGPETVLDGKFGFLEAYCHGHQMDPAVLTSGLRENWEVLRICLKRYACHMAAHAPVQTLRELMTDHSFKGADVSHVMVEVSEKVLTHHLILEPGDVMQAQTSVPFCIALALFRDPDDAASFDESALAVGFHPLGMSRRGRTSTGQGMKVKVVGHAHYREAQGWARVFPQGRNGQRHVQPSVRPRGVAAQVHAPDYQHGRCGSGASFRTTGKPRHRTTTGIGVRRQESSGGFSIKKVATMLPTYWRS